jgi:3D (Asp-Asp-Asp) domain-containing protein
MLLTLFPGTGNCQPQEPLLVIATAYCLPGHTTSGPKTSQVKGGCIALSRTLAKDLGLKIGPGQFDYLFGVTVEVIGVGCFTFADLMPPRWTHYRVDIWFPTLKQCNLFDVKKCQVKVVND